VLLLGLYLLIDQGHLLALAHHGLHCHGSLLRIRLCPFRQKHATKATQSRYARELGDSCYAASHGHPETCKAVFDATAKPVVSVLLAISSLCPSLCFSLLFLESTGRFPASSIDAPPAGTGGRAKHSHQIPLTLSSSSSHNNLLF
jgi:hypothetical protein